MKKVWLTLDSRSKFIVYLLQAVVLLRVTSFFTAFPMYAEVKAVGEIPYKSSSMMIGFVLYFFVFGFLIVRVMQKSRWAKFYTLMLTLISLLATYPIFQHDFGTSTFVRYLQLLLQSILLLWATILLFLKRAQTDVDLIIR